MKPEQRLLLALGLALGILLAWTTLFPPPPPPPRVVPSRPTGPVPSVLERSVRTEPILNFTVGSLNLGIGADRGGIRTLWTDGTDLMQKEDPGLLELEILEPSASQIEFQQTHLYDGVLLSELTLSPALAKINRRIRPAKNVPSSMLDLNLNILNISKETKTYRLQTVAYRPLQAKSAQDRQYLQGFVSIDRKMHKIPLDPQRKQRFPGSPEWITAQARSHALIVQPVFPGGLFHVEQTPGGQTVGWLEFPPVTLAPAAKAEWNLRLYAGPMTVSDLAGSGLEGAFSFGAFFGIAKMLLGILRWSYGWLGNYGWAILFLSVSIWLLFFPITWSGVRMMKVMGEIQPQVEKIRKEQAKNPQKMNQEILQLYRKYRVNPLSGCLPLILQMPIFIALFQVLTRSPELRGAGFLWIRDLSAPDAMIHFPKALPFLGDHLNLLPIVMASAMFFQQRMSQRPLSEMSEEQAMQQRIFRWFPILFGFMFYGLPSGLVLYWVTNTFLTMGQTLLAKRA